MPILSTARITLHRFESEAQLAGMRALFADPEVSRHLLVAFTREQGLEPNAERFRKNFDETWLRCGFGGVLLHEGGSPRPVGFVAFKPDTAAGRPPGAFETYFGVARPAWGRGYATEALRGLVELMASWLPPPQLRAAVDAAQSAAACRVLEKAGFAREGWVALADYASPALAAGSLELELWRLSRADAGDEVLEQAAFRIGQLAAAAQRAHAELTAAIGNALREGPFARRLGDERAAAVARRAFEAGTCDARYAIYAHRDLGR